jgi:hypothetical protein
MSSVTMGDEQRRQLARERVEAFRTRRRTGRLLVPVEVSPLQLAGLERLGLLERGARDKDAIASAIMRFLNATSPVATVGDALWPADEEPCDEGLAA